MTKLCGELWLETGSPFLSKGDVDEVESLKKVVNKQMELEAATNDARIALKQLQDVVVGLDA